MLFYLVTVGVFTPSPLIQFVNAEAWAVFLGLSGERPFWAVGLALGLAQTLGNVLLYLFGDSLLRRIQRLRRLMDRLDKERLRERAPYLLAVGSVVGLPPHNAMCLAAPLVDLPLKMVVTYTLIGRTLRFSALCYGAQWFADLLGITTDWIPAWLRALA